MENERKYMSLRRQALALSWLTVGYNLIEGLASIILGILARSVALMGFGFDSFIESLSGGVMIWRFSKEGDMSGEEENKLESRALKLVGLSLLILGVYVLLESVIKLWLGERPEAPLFGMLISIASLAVMPLLYYLKSRTATSIGSNSLAADSKQTLACMFLSVALLTGLLLNRLFGWWQADPIAAICICAFIFREAKEALAGGDEDVGKDVFDKTTAGDGR